MSDADVIARIVDYVKHRTHCALYHCGRCKAPIESDIHYAGTVDSHVLVPQTCDCGLTELLNALPAPPAVKTYLGDGVYAELEGLDVILTTEDGIRVTNRIVLEPEVLDSLNRYLQREFQANRMHAKMVQGGER